MSSSSNPSPTKARVTSALQPAPTARPSLSRSPSSSALAPFHLTIRFSASIPDLHLDIHQPAHTTIVALRHLIRRRLPEPYLQRRLRFIHGGKILPDAAALSAVLKAPPPPPRDGVDDPKGKGKAVEGRPAAQERVYVNCSIGDILAEAELAAEAAAATTPATELGAGAGGTGSTGASRAARGGAGSSTGLQTDDGGFARSRALGNLGPVGAQGTATRGFDRLLSAGFTPAEVNQLRLQFRSIQASRHTPDTMPSPDTLRTMEDAWIDNNNAGISSSVTGGGSTGEDGTAAGDGEDGPGIVGLLDTLMRGMMIGFMWPLASIGWLIREEGLWPRRWQFFVSVGVILSLTIGTIRSLSADR